MKTKITPRGLVAPAWKIPGLLDGRVTQWRVPVKPQPSPGFLKRGVVGVTPQWPHQDGVRWFMADGMSELVKCPLGKPGDRLFVKEAFADAGRFNKDRWRYRATDGDREIPFKGSWKPSVHMPAWAARIWLEIESVRVERVNAISEADAQAEGCLALSEDGNSGYGDDATLHRFPQYTYRWGFKSHWNFRHPGSWDRNDWVWAISFRRVEAS